MARGHSVTFSTAFWEIIEQAGLNDLRCRHVLFSDEAGRACGLASFYTITTDIAIFAPRWLRGLLALIRRRCPDFLKMHMLECGTPITLNSPPFIVAEGVPAPAVIAALHAVLHDSARAAGQWVIVLRDFEANAAALRADLQARGYHWVRGLPNTYLEIRWPTLDAYLASLQSYYRSKLLRHLRRSRQAGIRHELCEDFAAQAQLLCRQWLVVHHSAEEFQREVLTPAFYHEFALRLGNRSKVLLFYRGAELIGHALLLLDGELLRWLYFGRTARGNDSLYIYAGHAVIDTAIRLGAKRLELGLTTYPVKQDLGARAEPISFALRSPWPLINPLLGLIYPLLNRVPSPRDKRVFKTMP